MEILFGIAQESQLSYHLHGLLENGEGLILYAGNQLPRGKLGEKRRSDVGKLLSLVGLLLYKLKNKKEDYMENSAFLLGQVLKISDGLHALYCEKKREGDIPPQLAGNSVLVAASENPVQALALLVTRMNPYISWAKQSKNRLAGWYLGCYEDVMTKLQTQVTANMRYTEFDKAQLFIGYLAKLPSSEDKKQPDDKIQNVHKGDENE